MPHRYLVTFAQTVSPTTLQARVRTGAELTPGTRILHVHPSFGIAVVQSDPDTDDDATLRQLQAQPGVAFVVHDRLVSAQTLAIRAVTPALIGVAPAPSNPSTPPYDTYYTQNPQGWAVLQSGGFGEGIAGGTTPGPWNTTLGAGIRIAILDTGVDPSHPDLAPNLALNLSEINQSPSSGVPSPCDDGSPADQEGHGTWTASLAAAALGPGTGLTVGVAPQATLLNIKVLERYPDPSSTAPDIATQCSTGQGQGLLSWVIQGIQDAVANHADVISLSLGALVDLQSSEGSGLRATFDRVTQSAFNSGAVLIASAGNDAVALNTGGRYFQIPAQSRNVLPVVASTNPACAEDLTTGHTCAPGPVTLPYYSNFGSALNAIAAPGGSYPEVFTPDPDTAVTGWIRGACSNGLPNTGSGPPAGPNTSFGCFSLGHTQYVEAIGTSASAPLVAGAAALIKAANPAWTPTQIVAALRSKALPVSSLPQAPVLNPNLLP